MNTYTRSLTGSREGFSLVEVIVALVILAVGVLGLAGTTALVVRQVTMADLATERSAALQSVIEGLRATPYDNLTDGGDNIGLYSVSWGVASLPTSTMVEVVTTGPGMVSGTGLPHLGAAVADTFVYRIIAP